MPSLDRFSRIAAATLLLAACSHEDDRTVARNDSAGAKSATAGDPRKVSADTTRFRHAADSAAARPPDSAPRAKSKRVAKPDVRMAPGERTDKTPSIPVNPPVVKPD